MAARTVDGRPRQPLRRSLVVAIGGVAFGAVIVTAGLTLGLLRLTAERVTLADLRREADRVEQIAVGLDRRQGRQATPREVLARAGSSEIRFIADGQRPPDLPALPGAEGVVEIDGRQVYFVQRETAIRGRPGTLLVLRPAADTSQAFPGLPARLLVAVGVALTVSAAVAYWLSGRLTRPLRDLSRAARGIARGEPVRIEPPPPDEPGEVADLRRALSDLSRDLRAARERERSFLLSVSHELRTPLTAIRGYGEALADGTARGATRAGRVIVRESGRLERLVQDLLDLSRMQAGEFSVQLEDVDLRKLCADAVESLRPRAIEGSVTLTGPGAGERLEVRTDPDRAHQLVANLAENALRVTPAGGSVRLSVQDRRVTIADSGPGLDAEDIAHAFDRFYLWRKYRGERAVGSGLGLAIVGELARLMRVGVEVESGDDGTRFVLEFPAVT